MASDMKRRDALSLVAPKRGCRLDMRRELLQLGRLGGFLQGFVARFEMVSTFEA